MRTTDEQGVRLEARALSQGKELTAALPAAEPNLHVHAMFAAALEHSSTIDRAHNFDLLRPSRNLEPGDLAGSHPAQLLTSSAAG